MGHYFGKNDQANRKNSPNENGAISGNRHEIAGLASRQRGVVALALAIAGLSFGSCAGVRETEREVPRSVLKVDPSWSFMNGSQRKSAEYIMALPCDEIERAIRGTAAAEISVHFELIRGAVELQAALKKGDQKEISEKARYFYSVAEKMEEGEPAKKFRELVDNPDTAFEVKMVQDYMVPAAGHALELAQCGVK